MPFTLSTHFLKSNKVEFIHYFFFRFVLLDRIIEFYVMLVIFSLLYTSQFALYFCVRPEFFAGMIDYCVDNTSQGLFFRLKLHTTIIYI